MTRRISFVVSVMPCTAKKFEIERDDAGRRNGVPDVDIAMTTRELAPHDPTVPASISIDLPDEKFDDATGRRLPAPAVIFGATGGVMEAALRTACRR